MKDDTCVPINTFYIGNSLESNKYKQLTQLSIVYNFLILFILSDHEKIQHPILMILIFSAVSGDCKGF